MIDLQHVLAMAQGARWYYRIEGNKFKAIHFKDEKKAPQSIVDISDDGKWILQICGREVGTYMDTPSLLDSDSATCLLASLKDAHYCPGNTGFMALSA